jgi:glutathione peroxidase
MSENIYSFSGVTMQGKELPLSNFQGKVVLVVNTASKCGFTPQFKGLEELYEKYKGKGLEVLGFPCNQFGKQDPGSNDEINQFCELNYGVTFTMFQKIDVNGDNTHPLFKFLKKQAPGVLGTEAIKWNFTKFLVDQNGKVLERYAPTDTPEKIEKDVARLLA